jgi:hypothetical protein
MKKVLFTQLEFKWLLEAHPKWIVYYETTDFGNILAHIDEWVAISEIFDAGREYQRFFDNLIKQQQQ